MINGIDWVCDFASKVEFGDLARGVVPEDKMEKYLNWLLGGGKPRATRPAVKASSGGGIVKIAGNVALPAAVVMQVGMGIWEGEAIEARFAQGSSTRLGGATPMPSTLRRTADAWRPPGF